LTCPPGGRRAIAPCAPRRLAPCHLALRGVAAPPPGGHGQPSAGPGPPDCTSGRGGIKSEGGTRAGGLVRPLGPPKAGGGCPPLVRAPPPGGQGPRRAGPPGGGARGAKGARCRLMSEIGIEPMTQGFSVLRSNQLSYSNWSPPRSAHRGQQALDGPCCTWRAPWGARCTSGASLPAPLRSAARAAEGGGGGEPQGGAARLLCVPPAMRGGYADVGPTPPRAGLHPCRRRGPRLRRGHRPTGAPSGPRGGRPRKRPPRRAKRGGGGDVGPNHPPPHGKTSPPRASSGSPTNGSAGR
jgi:hypothetical protein